MTQQEKKRFLRQLIDGVRTDIMCNIPVMPEAWEGHELRAYVNDRFRQVDMGTLTGQRRREYENDISVFNLL